MYVYVDVISISLPSKWIDQNTKTFSGPIKLEEVA